ncbi:hypothetical protein EQH50_10155 [Klebsiella quasipneumoniae]|nr:hypothetical protein EQH50_10155 [Klebsiella quasipneumoniae]
MPGLQTAPAFRERLSDFEAVSTGSFIGPMSGGDSHTGSGPRRPGKATAATRQECRYRALYLARRRCACPGLQAVRAG